MNDNEPRNESVADGVFDEIAAQNHETFTQQGRPDRAANDPAATGAVGAQNDRTEKQKQKVQKNEATEEDEGDNAAGLDSQDFSREPQQTEEAVVEEDNEPSQQVTPETVIDWKQGLPPDPGELTVQKPTADEFGQIDPLEYTDYLKASVRHDMAVEAYNNAVVNKVFEVAEKILPEMKESKALQESLRNTFASTLSADGVIELAKEFRTSFDKIAGESKAQGAQNAKTSITIQKNAAIESKGSTQKKPVTTKNDALDRRLSRNDTSAFEELMGNWLAEGKI